MKTSQTILSAAAPVVAVAALFCAPATLSAQTPGTDPVARLQARIDSGLVTLAYDSLTGWLPSVLEALDIPVSSQGLVFSRTSLQTDRIAPWAPRAVYYNDDVYIGFVQDGGLMEVAAVSPNGGTEFYSVTQLSADKPTFERETTTCLMCHESRSLTGGVPGLIVRSVLTDRLGYPIGEVHSGLTTERTDMEQRWGGWYVTGEGASLGHAGNVFASDLRHEVADVRQYVSDFDFQSGRSDDAASQRFDPTAYLSPHSDVIALTVLLHQVRVHNLIAMAHESAREALREMGTLQLVDLNEVVFEDLQPAGQVRVDGAVSALIDGMLFVREVPLAAPVQGTSGFAEEFQAKGLKDSQGRSLRDLDLQTRTFRYPLSFLIYTDPFDGLPPLVKRRVYARLDGILRGTVSGSEFDHISEADRTAILEILRETKPEFPGT